MKKIEQRTMTDKEALQEYIRVADLQENMIDYVLNELHAIIPFKEGDMETLTKQHILLLDSIISRFSKLQDIIGAKIFPLIIEFLKEDTPKQSMIDKFNILEKLDYLPSADDWDDLRKIRNTASHEYPQNDLAMVNQLNKILNAAQILVNYWKELRVKLDGVIEKAK